MGAVHEGKKNIQATIYLDLFDQQSCDSNQVGEFKCSDCDDILCQKCFKAHSRLRLTCTHVVAPISATNCYSHEGKKLYNSKICDKTFEKSVVIVFEIHTRNRSYFWFPYEILS